MDYKEVEGNLIQLALEGEFDVIAHGCNCHCIMGAGIAPQMANAFGCDTFEMEADEHCGDINKLGTIDYEKVCVSTDGKAYNMYSKHLLEEMRKLRCEFYVVNAYTQFGFGSNHSSGTAKPVDYEAITLCMRKMNKEFQGLNIGLPLIGCGLAGGDWTIVSKIIKDELKDCQVTIVHFKPKTQEHVSEYNTEETVSS